MGVIFLNKGNEMSPSGIHNFMQHFNKNQKEMLPDFVCYCEYVFLIDKM